MVTNSLLGAIAKREGVWQQIGAAIERGDWDAIDKMGSEYNLSNLKLIADAGRSLGRLRGELAAMSPAQRRAPAYGFLIPEDHPQGTQRQVVAMVFEAERASGLVPADAKGARPVIALYATGKRFEIFWLVSELLFIIVDRLFCFCKP